MRFIEQQIKGLYLIKPNTHEDNRGVFHRSYCEDELKQVGINFKVKQGNISENFNKHTLRGFHFQKPPSKESKIISCVTGALFNVVIDLRRDSKTYHQSVILSISSHIKESIHVPAGCANAFLTMADNTIVHYYMGDSFNPDTYAGIRYNDPMFSINWPCEPSVISDRDLNIPDYLGK
jgi:dTDP-4-dehydrorhamnose 3,5-epimerase|tara:strand:- start:5551 stop:6084 length:534 start_codon:yes stop_codon:yes gene_type:complete